MGIETAFAVVAVGATVGKSISEANSASAKEAGLVTQGKEMLLQSEQKTAANYEAMKKVMSAQLAHQSVTGTTISSPSFAAVQRETYAIAGRNESNIALEEDITENNLKLEKDNVRNTLYSQLFGNAVDLGFAGFNAYNKMPTKAPTKVPGG